MLRYVRRKNQGIATGDQDVERITPWLSPTPRRGLTSNRGDLVHAGVVKGSDQPQRVGEGRQVAVDPSELVGAESPSMEDHVSDAQGTEARDRLGGWKTPGHVAQLGVVH